MTEKQPILRRLWLFAIQHLAYLLALPVVAVLAGSAYGVWAAGFTYAAWAPFAELVVLSVGLFSLILVHRQLRAQTSESRKEFKWRKIQAFFEYFPVLPSEKVSREFWDLAAALEIGDCCKGFGTPISKDAVRQICADFNCSRIVKEYLDAFESFAGAVNCGLIDPEFAACMERGRVLRAYNAFRPFVEELQLNNPRAYVELELLAGRWESDRKEEDRKKKTDGAVKRGALNFEAPTR